MKNKKNTRMCLACRQRFEKESLMRIVRKPNGNISFGNKDGRGAYLCFDRKCADKAIKKKMIPKMLKTQNTQLSEEVYKAVYEEVYELIDNVQKGG
ncbi:MAG: YlxR family protein [Ruminococcus sp.]|jgi:predicted RNA-binding protein YlxR (DUF448 family)|nr:YlxR family protein [Ruminococcus sp.]